MTNPELENRLSGVFSEISLIGFAIAGIGESYEKGNPLLDLSECLLAAQMYVQRSVLIAGQLPESVLDDQTDRMWSTQ